MSNLISAWWLLVAGLFGYIAGLIHLNLIAKSLIREDLPKTIIVCNEDNCRFVETQECTRDVVELSKYADEIVICEMFHSVFDEIKGED